VSLLLKGGKQNSPHTMKFFRRHSIYICKNCLSILLDGPTKFEETELPPIECFYNSLTDELLMADDYERAQNIWTHYGIENLGQYHDHYLLSDVLLLADVFQHFRHDVLRNHGLDCLYFPTLSSLVWSMALKHTQAEIDLITDPDMYLTIESGIRGGIAAISGRYANANNPLLPDYDPQKPTSYIIYLNANNLYGAFQSESLPVGDFRFLSQQEIAEFELESVPENSPTGYIISCDLEYPKYLHESHSDYSLAPEHLTVD